MSKWICQTTVTDSDTINIKPLQEKLEKLLKVNSSAPEPEIEEQKRTVERISIDLYKLISMVSTSSSSNNLIRQSIHYRKIEGTEAVQEKCLTVIS